MEGTQTQEQYSSPVRIPSFFITSNAHPYNRNNSRDYRHSTRATSTQKSQSAVSWRPQRPIYSSSRMGSKQVTATTQSTSITSQPRSWFSRQSILDHPLTWSIPYSNMESLSNQDNQLTSTASTSNSREHQRSLQFRRSKSEHFPRSNQTISTILYQEMSSNNDSKQSTSSAAATSSQSQPQPFGHVNSEQPFHWSHHMTSQLDSYNRSNPSTSSNVTSTSSEQRSSQFHRSNSEQPLHWSHHIMTPQESPCTNQSFAMTYISRQQQHSFVTFPTSSTTNTSSTLSSNSNSNSDSSLSSMASHQALSSVQSCPINAANRAVYGRSKINTNRSILDHPLHWTNTTVTSSNTTTARTTTNTTVSQHLLNLASKTTTLTGTVRQRRRSNEEILLPNLPLSGFRARANTSESAERAKRNSTSRNSLLRRAIYNSSVLPKTHVAPQTAEVDEVTPKITQMEYSQSNTLEVD
jgi:hypothetical protein